MEVAKSWTSRWFHDDLADPEGLSTFRLFSRCSAAWQVKTAGNFFLFV
jgi:hypothetical protein